MCRPHISGNHMPSYSRIHDKNCLSPPYLILVQIAIQQQKGGIPWKLILGSCLIYAFTMVLVTNLVTMRQLFTNRSVLLELDVFFANSPNKKTYSDIVTFYDNQIFINKCIISTCLGHQWNHITGIVSVNNQRHMEWSSQKTVPLL